MTISGWIIFAVFAVLFAAGGIAAVMVCESVAEKLTNEAALKGDQDGV